MVTNSSDNPPIILAFFSNLFFIIEKTRKNKIVHSIGISFEDILINNGIGLKEKKINHPPVMPKIINLTLKIFIIFNSCSE